MIYVQGLESMRAFYVACLGLVVAEQDDTTAMLRRGGWTLHLVTVPPAVAATIELSDPPRRRAETPLKPVFEIAGSRRSVGGSPSWAEGSIRRNAAVRSAAPCGWTRLTPRAT